jgi:hypothetical protein
MIVLLANSIRAVDLGHREIYSLNKLHQVFRLIHKIFGKRLLNQESMIRAGYLRLFRNVDRKLLQKDGVTYNLPLLQDIQKSEVVSHPHWEDG